MVGSAHEVLAWLGSTVLRVGLLSWGYLGSPMIHCFWLGSARLGLAESELGYICISAALSLAWQELDWSGCALVAGYWGYIYLENKKRKDCYITNFNSACQLKSLLYY